MGGTGGDKERKMKRFGQGVGIVVGVAVALWGGGLLAGPTPGWFYFADGFDRLDSTDMGEFWTEQWSDWEIEDGHARSAAGPNSALMTVDGFQSTDPYLEVTVRYDLTIRPTYIALVSLYLDNDHNIFIKIQDWDHDGLFDTVWFYMGNNSQEPWGDMEHGYDDWEDLAPYFSEARIATSVVGDEIFVAIDRDFDGNPDPYSVYSRDQIPLGQLGLGVGLGGYDQAWADNFLAVPEPATLVLMGLGAGALLARRPRK